MVVSAGLALKVAVLSLHGNPRTSNSGALSAVLACLVCTQCTCSTRQLDLNVTFDKKSSKSHLSQLCVIPGFALKYQDSLVQGG